ncbi:MFS transporter [Nocardioides sp. JQ2195]|nr:MFS transporter [Nocardioides sp. JQ2195]
MKGGTWIEDWRPEDPAFWGAGGATVARRNLLWSIFSEHLGFSVWLLWSVTAAMLVQVGFAFTTSQLFVLVAVPNLVGALVRLPYTFAVPRFGGRNWTVVSASLLLVPTLLFAHFVQRPGTPYWVFVLVAATAGLGGGNFASSMSNINFFYPTARKGAALGLNAAGGNLGVAVIQLFLPVVVGGAGLFGLVRAAEGGPALQRAGHLYAALALVGALCAWLFMNNLTMARSRPQLGVLRHRHTWVVSFLYIGTFGSFIGYSAALPLLIKLNFWVPTTDGSGAGIDFAHYAFLGALVGSVARPYGGWLADKYGGARVTAASFVAMIAATLAVLWSLSQLTPNPVASAAIARENQEWFPWFLPFFLLVFVATGIGNGSTYRMIPLIWRRRAVDRTASGTPERESALAGATRESSAVIGIAGAVGAIGGFLVPMTFGAPWVADPAAAVRGAFVAFASFYGLCLAVTWFCFLRRGFLVDRVPSLAGAGI